MHHTIAADEIFTGEEWLQQQAIVIHDGIIKDIIPYSKATGETLFFQDAFIAPAFIDVQVYGAAKKLFATYPTADTLQAMQQVFAKEGTALFQPTVATNSLLVFKACIDAVREYRSRGGKAVHGLHLEGPWINAEKKGAHIAGFIHAPTLDEVKELIDYGKDVITMVTLAPEVCSHEIIQLLASENIIVSAGHSNATYNESLQGFASGITAVTHLYNAMSPLHHREPGLTGATLQYEGVMASIIPDGHHVDYASISIAKKIMKERLFAITDAVTESKEGAYQHELFGDKYECNGTLSGSALSMYKAFYNLIHHAGIDISEALRMCSLYPAKVLKIENTNGKIAPQAAGHFIVMDKQLRLIDIII